MTNLAIASRVIGERDDDLDQSAIKQLEDAIQRHPLKASARIYRLLYYLEHSGLSEAAKRRVDRRWVRIVEFRQFLTVG